MDGWNDKKVSKRLVVLRVLQHQRAALQDQQKFTCEQAETLDSVPKSVSSQALSDSSKSVLSSPKVQGASPREGQAHLKALSPRKECRADRQMRKNNDLSKLAIPQEKVHGAHQDAVILSKGGQLRGFTAKMCMIAGQTLPPVVRGTVTSWLISPRKESPRVQISMLHEAEKSTTRSEYDTRANLHPDLEANLKAMERKRMAFVECARKYLGVPYRQGAMPRESQEVGEYASTEGLYLDCCGLVRRVLRDLKDELGFTVGPWNQAYLYDTLPIKITLEEAKSGDLVFVQGRYHNPKKRVPKHSIVHVEIFIGGDTGVATLGSRRHTQAVDIHDSYLFQSSTYTIQAYHFRSIDTWLKGVCRSHCDAHPWV